MDVSRTDPIFSVTARAVPIDLERQNPLVVALGAYTAESLVGSRSSCDPGIVGAPYRLVDVTSLIPAVRACVRFLDRELEVVQVFDIVTVALPTEGAVVTPSICHLPVPELVL